MMNSDLRSIDSILKSTFLVPCSIFKKKFKFNIVFLRNHVIMTAAETCFLEIYEQFPLTHDGAIQGKMMSSDALKVHNKVFCFYYEKEDAMCFKLGKDTDPDRPELLDASLLNPFKNKGPLKGWFVVPFTDKSIYLALTEEAFERVGSM